jgi:acylphosphatase
MDENSARLHAIVSGLVQGVSFRYFVLEQARMFSITGWVRNLWNGGVEVTAEGSRENLENFLMKLHEGPSMARVDDVNVEWQSFNREFQDFRIRHTNS